MVGKDSDIKNSRIFHQCYLKCCKLQNLTPLANLNPLSNGKVLDFCVDRIKYQDWPPILNALSCDLSLHSVSIKCRQVVKTVLEQIDCERLAKTVNKRAVILTNFLLKNLIEALVQMLQDTTLMSTLRLEGLPLKIPYLNPLCEILLVNSSLQHLHLPRCLIGDAGCMALCKVVRCLPNLLTLDLSGCDLTPQGAGYIADLIKFQKIHRYSENWIHTLRYRLPDLDTMAGLRRISLCGNTGLGDAGVNKVLEVLADDLWIKALDIQNCGLSDESAEFALQVMSSNTALVVLDLRGNPGVCQESMIKVRASLRQNERREHVGEYPWLSSSGSSVDGRSTKSNTMVNKNVVTKPPIRNLNAKYSTKVNVAKKEKEYTEVLEEQLRDEMHHRQQLEELNMQLVEQLRQLKKQQMTLWTQGPTSSGSEQSLQGNSTCDSSGRSSTSSCSVPIDQNTLSYIQQAFKDIYMFIKNNQCQGQCQTRSKDPSCAPAHSPIQELPEMEEYNESDVRASIVPKKVHSAHMSIVEKSRKNKITRSAHLLMGKQDGDMISDMDMFERQIGDSARHLEQEDNGLLEEMMALQKKHKRNLHDNVSSACSSSSIVSASETIVDATQLPVRSEINPREALYSSSDEEDEDDGNS